MGDATDIEALTPVYMDNQALTRPWLTPGHMHGEGAKGPNEEKQQLQMDDPERRWQSLSPTGRKDWGSRQASHLLEQR